MHAVANEQGGIRGKSMDSTDRTSDSMVNDGLFGIGDCCQKIVSFTMIVHCAYLYRSALYTIRASRKKLVPLYRASRRAWIDTRYTVVLTYSTLYCVFAI
jgi:hypothetical protein